MDDNQNLMALDVDDCITRLKSGLSDAREKSRVQQNTLDDMLWLLQHIHALGDPHIPGDLTTAPQVAIPTILTSDSTPHTWVCSLKPATPNDFDGDRLKGWTFLNLCQLYIALCKDPFIDEQAQIHWALSFMKSRCTTLYVNCILWKEASDDLPACHYNPLYPPGGV